MTSNDDNITYSDYINTNQHNQILNDHCKVLQDNVAVSLCISLCVVLSDIVVLVAWVGNNKLFRINIINVLVVVAFLEYILQNVVYMHRVLFRDELSYIVVFVASPLGVWRSRWHCGSWPRRFFAVSNQLIVVCGPRSPDAGRSPSR